MLTWHNLICSAVEHSPEGRGQRGCERKVTSGQHSHRPSLGIPPDDLRPIRGRFLRALAEGTPEADWEYPASNLLP